MPISRLDPRGEARQRRAPALHAVQALGAGEIEEGLVDRQRLDQRRQLQHQRRGPARPTRTYFAMFGLITTASGQSASALNIGIAERTPKVRAM